MRTAVIAFVTCVALLTSVIAQPRKVLVLPLDGNAPAAQRTQLNASVAKLAKAKLDGDVTVGDTTFNETAAAVGCDPAQPACADTVRTTLQVDELVYGSAKTENGSTTVMVNRVSSTDSKSQLSVIAETDDGSAAESGLEPGFAASAASGTGSGELGSGSGSAESPAKKSSFFDTRERKLGVAFAAGGVLGLVLGFAFWSSASGLQDDIDAHPTATLAEIQDLKTLEDKAGSKALWGNIFFVAGLAAVTVGGYFLVKDHKNRKNAVVAPAPVEGGMTLVLGGRW